MAAWCSRFFCASISELARTKNQREHRMLKTGNRTTAINTPTDSYTEGDSGVIVQDGTQKNSPSMFVPTLHTALEAMPADLKNIIFTLAATPVEYQNGLLALAKTSKPLRGAVLDFMRNNENGQSISAVLKIGPAPIWQARAQTLQLKANTYRKDFGQSAASVSNNIAMKLTGAMATDALARFSAVEFNLSKFDLIPEIAGQVSQQIGSIRNKPLKINASEFKGDLQTLQSILQTLLASVHESCLLILDISNNGLHGTDLGPLLEFIKRKPLIYQLNLDGNPLCTGNQVTEEVVALFQLSTPISHLYLKQTGVNDATAIKLSEALGQCSCLKLLDLRANGLTAVGAQALVAAVGSILEEDALHAHSVLQAILLQANNFRKTEVMKILPTGSLDPRSLNIVKLEDLTFFSSNFNQEALNQQSIQMQFLASQRL